MEFSKEFRKYYNVACENRKYLLLYLVLVVVLTLSFASIDNYLYPTKEVSVFILAVILGTFSILYYVLHDYELHKVAFVIIISFGLLCAFLTPIALVPDEQEHFIRSELTSSGVIIPDPQFVNGSFSGFNTIQGAGDLANSYGNTVFTTDVVNAKINYTPSIYGSAFMQNPFFGYLAQGFGILLAKLLDLTSIWMLWLGRIANLILYAALISLAVKKSPVFKIPLIAMATLPLAIFQAASVSIDVTVNGLGFLVFAYFLFMLKSEENSLDLKNIAIFSTLTLLLALCKLPYLAFIFLLFLVPKSKFKTPLYYNIISFAVVTILAVLWAKYYATPNYLFSYRANYFIENNVSMAGQIDYISNHLMVLYVTLANVPNYIGILLPFMFLFSFPPFTYESSLLTVLGLFFIAIVVFMYPNINKISLKTRVGLFLIMGIVFYGTFLIQLLTWSSVGVLWGVDIQARYFIPLFAIAPVVFGFNNRVLEDKRMDKLIIIFSIVLLTGFVILTACKFY